MRRASTAVLAAVAVATFLFSRTATGAQERRAVKIAPGEHGAVVLHVWGIGLPPARPLNPAQAEVAARTAAEIDAYSRVAYLLGRIDRRDGERLVTSFRGRFKGIHVGLSERLPDGSVRTEVTITVPANQVPELLERIDEYIGEAEARRAAPAPARP